MSPRDKDATSTDELANRFAGLAVYEPSKEFQDAPDIARPVKVESDTATYEAEVPSTLEDAFFALTAVINDVNTVRSHIQWIWSNYNIGTFDVAAAAIATNTAIDLVRNMTEEIMLLLSQHGGLGKMLMGFHLAQCLNKGWKMKDIIAPAPGSFNDNLNYQTYDILDGTYLGPYRMIESFLSMLQPQIIPLCREEVFGTYDPRIDRSRLSGPQKNAQDRALLMPFFTELVTIIRGVPNFTVRDEFLRGLEEAIKTQNITFGLVFAAQAFLDITYELGEGIERPFQTLTTHSSVISNDIGAHFDFHTFKLPNWAPTNDLVMRQLKQNIEWLGKDPSGRVQERLYRKMGRSPPEQGHRIFRMSPVISGLTLYNLRLRYREIGLTVADSLGSIQYCQHLYNALRQEKLIDSRWADMEVMYTLLGDDSFYVGGKNPTSCADYFMKFCLQMGTSAAAMTGKGRKNTPMASKSGPRGLKRGAPVLYMFEDRYVNNTGQVDLTPERVDQIVEMSLWQQEEVEGGGFQMGQIDDPSKLREKKKQQMGGVSKKATEGAKLRTEELVKSLTFSLHAETLEFAFPYLTFHRQCWRLLRSVKEECDGLLRQIYTPAYIERENQLPWVVGWIFMSASGQDGVSDRRLLQIAAEVFRVFIDHGSSLSSLVTKEILGRRLAMPIEFGVEA